MATLHPKPKRGQKIIFNEEGEGTIDTKPQGVMFDPGVPWYNIPLPELHEDKKFVNVDHVSELETCGLLLLKEDSERFSETLGHGTADKRMLQTLISSGTTSDRISALTLLVQESPIHAVKALETLLSICSKKSRNEATQAITTLKDLFIGGLLPDRKLKYMKQQSCLGSKNVTDKHLMVWAFESFLKSFYFKYIQIIEALSFDALLFVKSQMVSTIYDLLKAKPEQEQNLLKLLINKLGDKENKIASKASYSILQLEASHPAMKLVITKEIERFIFAPSTSRTSCYYTLITLNQTVLTHKQVDVANLLIEIYFVFFTKLLFALEKEEVADAPTLEKKSLQSDSKNKKSQKRKKDEDLRKEAEENVNSRVISAVLTGVNRAYPFAEVNSEKFDKHMNTLFAITHTASFNTSVQVLMLIFQASASRDFISDRYYKSLYESLLDPRLTTSSKQSLYLNLLYKSLIIDNNIPRVRAFIKRMVQVSAWQQPPLVTGLFHVIHQLVSATTALRSMFTNAEIHDFDGDEEEVFKDVEEDDVSEDQKVDSDKDGKLSDKQSHSAYVVDNVSVSTKKEHLSYDGRKRDPQYSNADGSCLWEIHPFLNHFHPTVSLLAKSLVYGEKILGKPNLSLHTLNHFLDKFAYRNPKKSAAARGHSIMQPLAGGLSKGYVPGSTYSGVPMNSEQFTSKKQEEIPVDELFFYRFFNDKYIKGKQARKTKVDRDEEGEIDEDEVWKALVDSKPQLEMDEEESDFDSEEMDKAMTDMGSDSEQSADENDNESMASEEKPMFSDEENLSEIAHSEDEFDDTVDFFEDENDLLPFNETDDEEEIQTVDHSETHSHKKKKRKAIKDLPVFADAESYAHLLEN